MKYFFIFLLFPIINVGANPLILKNITIKDYPIEYYQGGKKKPVFLLVHGLGVDKHSFYDLAEVLVKDHLHHVLLPDIPGQGNTPKIQERNYSIEVIADFLYDFLKQLKIKKVVIIGNSMGGHIASVFSIKYSHLVSHLILINPAGIENEKEKPYLSIPLEEITDIQTKKSLEWNNKIREDIRNGKYYIMNPFLEQIKPKTILFWGKDDSIISYKNSAIWATEIRNLRFYVLKGGHLLQQEKPKEIVRIILNEIKQN